MLTIQGDWLIVNITAGDDFIGLNKKMLIPIWIFVCYKVVGVFLMSVNTLLWTMLCKSLCDLEPAGTGTLRRSCILWFALQLPACAVHSWAAAQVSAGVDIF
jgi:hypothetical protein